MQNNEIEIKTIAKIAARLKRSNIVKSEEYIKIKHKNFKYLFCLLKII